MVALDVADLVHGTVAGKRHSEVVPSQKMVALYRVVYLTGPPLKITSSKKK